MNIDWALIISGLTAIALLGKMVFDGKSSTLSAKGGYVANLTTSMNEVTEKNLDLQKQLDDKQKQIDELKATIYNMNQGSYRLVLDIKTGARPGIHNASISIVPAETG